MQPISRFRRHRQLTAGFTLIEVMVVLAILAAIMAVGAPRLFNTSAAMRSAIRKIAIMTRELRNGARLTGSTKRLVISMNNEKGHKYWVETAPGIVTLLSVEKEKDLEKLTEIQKKDQGIQEDFAIDAKVTKKPELLPRGLYFESVEFARRPDPVTEGTAYIHFFPQGLAEEAAIHVTDRKTLNWTILINPLTGRADVLERKVLLKDLRQR